MEINYSQHHSFSKFPVVVFMSCQPEFAEGLQLMAGSWRLCSTLGYPGASNIPFTGLGFMARMCP